MCRSQAAVILSSSCSAAIMHLKPLESQFFPSVIIAVITVFAIVYLHIIVAPVQSFCLILFINKMKPKNSTHAELGYKRHERRPNLSLGWFLQGLDISNELIRIFFFLHQLMIMTIVRVKMKHVLPFP